MISALADIAHYQTSSFIWRNVRPRITSFSAKNQSCLILYIIKRKFKFLLLICHLFHLVKRVNVYFIPGFATHEICIFASLDEINSIFIPKNWISSISCTPEQCIRCLYTYEKYYLTYPVPARGKDKNRPATHWKTSDVIVILKWHYHLMSHLIVETLFFKMQY